MVDGDGRRDTLLVVVVVFVGLAEASCIVALSLICSAHNTVVVSWQTFLVACFVGNSMNLDFMM